MFIFAQITWQTTWWETCLRLLIAVVCGGLVGWDREISGRAAGLRTYMMVALGACGFTIVAMELINSMEAAQTHFNMDPTRIIAGVVGGIGFLGAGAIIQAGGTVRGLTTAAGLWVIAAVGMAAGAGYYLASGVITLLAFIILVALRRVEWAKSIKGDSSKPD